MQTIDVSVKGRWVPVPAATVRDRVVVVRGRALRIAAIHDEDWQEHPVADPGEILDALKSGAGGLQPDLFTFAQRLPDTAPRYAYRAELESVAAIRLEDPKDWWEQRLPQETRKNVRRAARRGLVVRTVGSDDELLRGIRDINNESPMRQGKPFHHYGKDLEAVRRDYAAFQGRSTFLGAFVDGQMVGFLQGVHMPPVAAVLQLLTMSSHYDKRPANALIAKAVEDFAKAGFRYLTYGKYRYGNKGDDHPLTVFKYRNGFEEFTVPRYYVPLSVRGRMALALNLHRGPLGVLPPSVIAALLNVRRRWYNLPVLRRAGVAQGRATDS